jgi:L-aspartate oxidase
MKKDESHYCDVLVIGSGIAGLSCAISAADLGLDVIVISKESSIAESNTFYAQGGIVARGQDDTPELLAEDIIEAGDGISNPDAVKIVAYDGPGLVEDFLVKKVGVPFSRSGEDEFEFAREASHSRRRILHSKDSTGKAIETALIAKAAEYSNIRTYPGYPAIDLLTIPHHSTSPLALYREPQCIGAYVLNNATGHVEGSSPPTRCSPPAGWEGYTCTRQTLP